MNHKMELIDLIKQGVVDRVLRDLEDNGQLDQYVDDLVENRIDPYTLSEEILNRFFTDTE